MRQDINNRASGYRILFPSFSVPFIRCPDALTNKHKLLSIDT